MGFAKKGLDAYNEHQSDPDVKKTGGHEYNSPDNSGHSGSPGPEINRDEAVRQSAEKHGSGETSLFESAMSFLDHNKDKRAEPLDEEHVTKAHHEAYAGEGAGGLSASALGGAAALETLKKFTGGSGSNHGSGSGGSQTKLISMAMAEAAKLFDKKQPASGNKQDAVNGAAMTVMKLLVQSKVGHATGGSNSGGLSGLLSLASKFA